MLLRRGLAGSLVEVRHHASLGAGRKSIVQPQAHTCCPCLRSTKASIIRVTSNNTTVNMNHPQTAPPPLPKWIDCSEFVTTARRHVESERQIIDKIVRTVPPTGATFDNAVLPFAEIEDACAGEQSFIAALRYAAVDARTQRAVEDAEQLYRDFEAELVQRSDYFVLLEQVKGKGNGHQLDEECRRYLDKIMHLYTSNGYGLLDPAQLKQFQEAKQEGEALGVAFERNIREHADDNLRFSLEELVGVPRDKLHRWPISADGHVDVPLQWANVCAITEHACESRTRQIVHEAWRNRLTSVNIPIFRRIVHLRHENARRLGYDTYAEFKLSERVVRSIPSVKELMQQLAQRMTPAAHALIRDCETKASTARLEAWDIPYYLKQIQAGNGADCEQIKEWFPAERTFRYMLDLLGSYFQLHFDELPREQIQQHVWAEDVGVFAVWDVGRENAFVGYLYKDLWARPLKFQGNQAVNLQPVRRTGAQSSTPFSDLPG